MASEDLLNRSSKDVRGLRRVSTVIFLSFHRALSRVVCSIMLIFLSLKTQLHRTIVRSLVLSQ